MRKIALLFLLALTAATGHAECVRFAADGTSANRLHYAVDYLGDMEPANLDRKVAHRAVEYIALRLQPTGLRKPWEGVVYEAAREFIVKECNK